MCPSPEVSFQPPLVLVLVLRMSLTSDALLGLSALARIAAAPGTWAVEMDVPAPAPPDARAGGDAGDSDPIVDRADNPGDACPVDLDALGIGRHRGGVCDAAGVVAWRPVLGLGSKPKQSTLSTTLRSG